MYPKIRKKFPQIALFFRILAYIVLEVLRGEIYVYDFE